MSKRSSFVLLTLGLLTLLALAIPFLLEDEDPSRVSTPSETLSTPTSPSADAATPTTNTSHADDEDEGEVDTLGEVKTLSLDEGARPAPERKARPQSWKPAEGSFTGRVLGPNGEGVPNAKVDLLTLNEKILKGIPEGMRGMWLAQIKKDLRQLMSMLTPAGSAKTDPEGRFSLEAPKTTRVEHWIVIRHPTYIGVLSTEFKAAPTHLEVTLSKGGTVELTLVAPSGAGIEQPQASLSVDTENTPAVPASPLQFSYETASLSAPAEWKGGVQGVTSASYRGFGVETAEAEVEVRPVEAKTKAKAQAPQEEPKLKSKTPAQKPRVARSEPPPPQPKPPAKEAVAVFRSVPPGRHEIHGSAKEYRTTTGTVVVLPGQETKLTITLREGLILRGIVVDEAGRPIEKAHVQAMKRASSANPRMRHRPLAARTRADGTFEVRGADEAVYTMVASAGGYRQTDWNVSTTPSADEPVRVVLTRTRAVSGRVVIEPGKTPAGAGLKIKVRIVNGPRWLGRGDATTNKDGTFTVENLVPGRYRLTAEGNKLTTLDPVTVTIDQEDVADVVLKVRTGMTAEVVVVDRDGSPVAKAKVQLHAGAATRFSNWEGRGKGGEVTDEKGKVEVSGLAPGEYRVKVKCEGYAGGKGTLRVDEDQAPETLRIQLDPEAILKCRILNADGSPFAKKMVMVMAHDTTIMSPEAFNNSVSTDDQGSFTRGGLAGGQYRLQLMDFGMGGSGGMRPVGEVRLEPGRTTEVELRLEPTTAKVTGRVIKGTKPQVGVQVMVYRSENLLAGFSQTRTDAEGKFIAGRLGAGTYIVSASGAAQTTVVVKDGAVVDVTLEIKAGTVAGQVRGPDGQPAKGAKLYLMRLDSPSVEDTFRSDTRTNSLGVFTLEKVVPGRYRLIATAPGVGSSSGLELQLGEDEARTGLDITLSAGGTLSVDVTRADGNPSVGTDISFYNVDLSVFSQQLSGWQASNATTDRRGRATLEHLIPGRYVVFASSASEQGLVDGIVIREGSSATTQLALAPGGTLEVTAAPGTTVTVTLVNSNTPLGGTGMPWSSLFGLSRTNSDGILEVPNLPSVEVSVTGKTADGQTVGPWRGIIPAGQTAKAALN